MTTDKSLRSFGLFLQIYKGSNYQKIYLCRSAAEQRFSFFGRYCHAVGNVIRGTLRITGPEKIFRSTKAQRYVQSTCAARE